MQTLKLENFLMIMRKTVQMQNFAWIAGIKINETNDFKWRYAFLVKSEEVINKAPKALAFGALAAEVRLELTVSGLCANALSAFLCFSQLSKLHPPPLLQSKWHC